MTISRSCSLNTSYNHAPSQFFSRGGGDCEDYAIVKYMALRELGFDTSNMRLVALYDKAKSEMHLVLSVRLFGANYILDNQLTSVLMDTQIGHYQPVYSINEQGWWRHAG